MGNLGSAPACKASETAGSGILQTDADARIKFLNRRMADMLGYAVSEVLGEPLFRLLDASAHELTKKRPQASKLSAWEQCELKFRRKDRGALWAIANICPMFDEKGYTGSLIMVTDVTASKHAEKELAQTNRQLRRLSTQLLHAQDQERRRLARELHDSTAQILTGISLNLRNLEALIGEDSSARSLLDETLTLADRCTREIRATAYGLHPPLLDELGLVTAVRVFAEGFEARTGLHIAISVSPDFERLDADVELAIFRIVQEALSNVHRHSGSARAAVRLVRSGDSVGLEVEDQGRGFPTRVRHGLGLLSMRERAEELGGKFAATSTSVGTRVTVVLPLAKPGPLAIE